MTGHGRNKDPANNAYPRAAASQVLGAAPSGPRGAGGRSAVAPLGQRVARGGAPYKGDIAKNDYLDQAFGLGARGAGDGRGAGTGVRHCPGAGPGRGESGRQRPVRAGLRRGLRAARGGGHPGAGRAVRRGRRRAVAAALRELEAAGWAPDVLVSNAGNQNRKPVVEMTPAEWQALQSVRQRRLQLRPRGAAGHGPARLRPHRADVVRGRAGHHANIAYATARGAIAAFARALAVEYGGSGITCNALAPGFVRTDFTGAAGQSAVPVLPVHGGAGRTLGRAGRYRAGGGGAWPRRRPSTARCWRSTAACWRA